MLRIALDAGHGINTAGKRSPCGVREWTLNNAVCLQIANQLRDYQCTIQRTDDTTGRTDPSLPTRVARARSFNADVLISIHHNAHLGVWGTATGTEVFSRTGSIARSARFAEMIAPMLANMTGLRNRGPKVANFGVLNVPAPMVAVLCEGGFMDNRNDFNIINSVWGQRRYAEAVVASLVAFFNIPRRVQTPSVPTGNTHTVRAGDTLSRIASVNNTTVAEIVRLNNIANPNIISVGQVLRLPAPSAPVSRFFPKATRNPSIVTMLNSIGVDSSITNRRRIAEANGINNYTGTVAQNTKLVNLLAAGKLVRP